MPYIVKCIRVAFSYKSQHTPKGKVCHKSPLEDMRYTKRMKLNPRDQERIHRFYKEALDRFGEDDVRSVQWTSIFGQKRRFEVLLNIENVIGSSVLDVGCGIGDMYKFLTEKDIEVDYTGIDIVPEFIETARNKFPSVRFEHQDILDIDESFDYVFASGALSFKVENNHEHYGRVIQKMYDIANKGVSFNMLDASTHVDNDTYAAYHPNEIAEYCSTFAERVEIVTDYLPQDFTVYLYK